MNIFIFSMPANSPKQRDAAGVALAAKRKKIPVSKLKGASKQMYNGMSADKLRHFASLKETMTLEQKKKLLHILKEVKRINEYISPVDHNVLEEQENVESKILSSKTTDWKSVLNSSEGVQFTDKEIQAIINYNSATENDINVKELFFVNYKISDTLGNNYNIIIRKHLVNPENNLNNTKNVKNKFKWYAFKQIIPKSNSDKDIDPNTLNMDTMTQSESQSFDNDIDGANILNTFLRQLNIPKKTD